MPTRAEPTAAGRTVEKRRTPTFRTSYEKLNTAQKNAVDTIEGPVMVIAGPGTGKTQVLAMRTANILAKTQMRPSNILCLTFSSSGAKAMRERLRQIIGPDSYGVTVSTIHGFCNDIILSHPHVFEDFRALEPISEIERLRVMRTLTKNLGPGSILGKPMRENDRAGAILSRISEMKREGKSPEDLRELTPLFQSEIKTTSSGKARDTSTQAYKDDLRLTQQYEEFILLYEQYNTVLDETHRYDHEDMILTCEKALRKHEWLLASLQERYQYVLVDEYQDTNGAQHQVIQTLTSEPATGQEPNLFVVGDDDQAIYRFQGASVGNMLSFLERFPEAAVITLTESYRSTQTILDGAGTLIEKNEERLVGHVSGVEKNLTSQQKAETSRRAQLDSTEPPILHEVGFDPWGVERPLLLRYPTPETEYAGIAEILMQSHSQGTSWSEMAILCRRNSELQEMHDQLFAAEIPTVLSAKRDLLLQESVLQAIAILRAIEHPDSDVALSAALSCKTFGIHPADLGRTWIAQQEVNRENKSHMTLREYFLKNETPLKDAFYLIEELTARKETMTLPALVENVLKESKLLPKEGTIDPEVIASLHAFYEYTKNRAYERKSLTLAELLADLDQYLGEAYLKLQYDTPHLVTDGVQLMTAHAAKGLEFALVIVPHLRYRNWGNRMQGSLLSLPDHLIFGHDKKREKGAKARR